MEKHSDFKKGDRNKNMYQVSAKASAMSKYTDEERETIIKEIQSSRCQV